MLSKQELRKIMLQKRRMVTAEQQQAASAAVCRKLADVLQKYPDGAVLSYLAYGKEIDLTPLHRELWRQGRTLAVPRTFGMPLGVMLAVSYKPDTQLQKTPLGVLEPLTEPEIDPADIGVVIAPGVAFGAAGERLGHGMGYYDRYLEQAAKLPVIGVCYAWQVVDEVPTDVYDRKMTLVVHD